jgi:hypothetical protein
MSTNKLPNDRDEKKLLLAIDKVTDLVDKGKLPPTEAVIKVAKEEKLSPGEIRLVCSAYNNGKQIAQFESNKNALDKLADFVLADADKVISAIYGSSENNLFKKSSEINDIFEMKKYAFDLPPYWWEEYEKTAWLKSLDGNLLKTAATETIFPEIKNKTQEENNNPLKNYDTLRKSHQYIKAAIDQLHKESCTLKEEIRRNVNNLKNYLSYNENYRISNQTIKEGIDAYFGDNIYGMQLKELLFGNIKEENIKKAQVKKLEKLSIDDYPLNKFAESVNLTKKYVQINNKINELDKQKKEIESDLKKIAQHVCFGSIDKNKNIFNIDLHKEKINSPYYLDLKKNFLTKKGESSSPVKTGPGLSGLVSSAAKNVGYLAIGQKIIGSKQDKKNKRDDEASEIEEKYYEYLNSPTHVNKLKYIEGLPVVISAMLDEEDPISGHKPEKVLKAYNELAANIPDLVNNPTVIKPILRKYLAGNFEPFEAKEILDMEEKYLRSKHILKNKKDSKSW